MIRQELTAPKRIIAASAAVTGGELPLVSARADAPTIIGQVLIENVCGLGSDGIITKNVAAR